MRSSVGSIRSCVRIETKMPVINFGPTPITPSEYKQLMTKGPVWITADGELLPIATLNDSHLRNIERWLRGGGATPGPLDMADEDDLFPFRVVATLEGITRLEEWQALWLTRLQREMANRGLAKLPDHENSYERRVAHEQQLNDMAKSIEYEGQHPHSLASYYGTQTGRITYGKAAHNANDQSRDRRIATPRSDAVRPH